VNTYVFNQRGALGARRVAPVSPCLAPRVGHLLGHQDEIDLEGWFLDCRRFVISYCVSLVELRYLGEICRLVLIDFVRLHIQLKWNVGDVQSFSDVNEPQSLLRSLRRK
jgi:hypothetical protein